MALVSLTKTTVKLAIASGAVYTTVERGVWSSNSRLGTKALGSIGNAVAPSTQEYINKIPTTQCTKNYVAGKWNTGVKTTFKFLADSPTTLTEKTKTGVGQYFNVEGLSKR